ncbi:MAG: hypothetical protein M1818_000434 [Claussenomyces sp. TS43310]|nr:MAG: hypothetical protein M1818_000434 [Claussenomyces sp. TS43310]
MECVQERALTALRPETFEFCRSGSFDKDSIVAIGGELDSDDAGIYLHLVWSKDDAKIMFLYVGQSYCLLRRISQHNNPDHPKKHPSLHYHAMDLDNMASAFVLLASQIPQETGQHQYLQNIIEMWCCLMFDTLAAADRQEYLPQGEELPPSLYGLNVVIPLWHGFSNWTSTNIWRRHSYTIPKRLSHMGKETEVWSGSNGLVKEYQKALRDRFSALRFSPNPQHQQYYFQVKRKAQATSASIKTARTVRETLLGVGKEVKTYNCQFRPGRYNSMFCVFVGPFCIWIPKTSLRSCAPTVHFRARLPDGERHSEMYASKAQLSDPAARLAIQITSQFEDSSYETTWLRSNGKQIVKKMNTSVDHIEGIPIEVITKTPRRWLSKGESQGRNEVMYT